MMDWAILLLIPVLAVTNGFLLDNSDTTVHLYVSPHGSDNNPGRDVGHPLQTIHKAVSHISHQTIRGKNLIIELMGGYHDLHTTLQITHTDTRRVTIRAYNNQQVHVTGGKRIQSQYFKPVTDTHVVQRLPSIARNKVLQVKLSDAGITNIGVMSRYGFHIQRTAPLEIFENGKPLTLARYPNNEFINIVSVPSHSDGKTFTYDSDRPKQWHGETDVWAHGFWYWSWADRSIKVQHLDPQHKNITLTKPALFGLRTGHYNISNPAATKYRNQGGYFKFVNVLSELDAPGEYYVDRDHGMLYLWPTTSKSYNPDDVIYASILNNCIQISGHSGNIVFEGFIIEACRKFGIQGYNVHDVTVSRMQIKNTGSYGLLFEQSTKIKISQSDIRNTDGGVAVSGGNRNTLTSSGNEVSDNVISHFGRVGLVGSDGIKSGGVANHVHHNVLWRGSYSGIHWSGNDHLFEYNHISEMCLNASDCGAMMTGRDWTTRGNVIRYNHIHDTKRLQPGADVRGIMLDDQYSSALIENNVFHDNDVHVNIGGGRDNIIRQNIFYNTLEYSMQIDSRGKGGGSNGNELLKKLHSVPYTNDLWRHRYPKLATITSNHPDYPMGNQIIENIFYSVHKENVHGYGQTFPTDWFNITNNAYAINEQNFYAPRYGNFKPMCTLQEFVSKTRFPDPVLPAHVGPRYPVGPLHVHIEQPRLGYKKGNIPSPTPCTTRAPLVAPTRVHLPDGSYPNTIYNVSRSGCWFLFDKCPNHPELQKDHRSASNQYYRDVNAENQDHSGINENACLGKVTTMINKCGTKSSFVVIYGPTGAMTLGGDGCYFAQYGCPKHGIHRVGFIRDVWAEAHQNAANDEQACLSRALPQWIYCGSSLSSPIVSIYRPTGHIRVAGGGCWIKPEKCPADNTLDTMFYDGWGAANLQTDDTEDSCLHRAETFWRHCGSNTQYKVTAYYRPHAKSFTYP